MLPSDIRAEAKKEWLSGFALTGRVNQYDEDFANFISSREDEIEREATEHLQPWLHILEDSIQWLANIAGILDMMNSEGKCDDSQRSIWALVGASCAHALAVRRLVLSGLDTTARATARILDEHLCVCIAFLHDRKLAEQFKLCEDDGDAANFWYKYLNTKALKKHLNAVERSIGLEPIASHDMRVWREKEINSFSQAVHPSYLGAALTTITLSASDPKTHGPAFLGKASVASERTLNFACKSIWYFCCLGFMLLFNEHDSQPPVITLNKEDQMHQIAVVGRNVIQALNIKYWKYEIYPQHEAS